MTKTNVKRRHAPSYYDKIARRWNRIVTVLIVALLLVPIPFIRFEAWPDGTLILQEPLTPWSHFQYCYVSFPDGVAVDEVYRFQWDGILPAKSNKQARTIDVPSMSVPLLQWQNRPELPLADLYANDQLLRYRMVWQPLLLWPFKMFISEWKNREI